MNAKHYSTAALAALSLTASQASAAIVIDTDEPVTDVLLDFIVGGSVGTNIDSTDNPGSRGGGFSLSSGLGGSEFDITSITLDAGANTLSQGFAFTVSIIQAGPVGSNPTGVYNQTFTAPGAGNLGGSAFATAVGGSLLGEETFTVDAGGLSTAAADFISFEFTSAIRVDADVNYAVLVSTTGAFAHFEGTGNANTASPTAFSRIAFQAGSTSTPIQSGAGASSRDFRYSITGTVVPEPSSAALLGLGGLALMLRRRKG